MLLHMRFKPESCVDGIPRYTQLSLLLTRLALLTKCGHRQRAFAAWLRIASYLLMTARLEHLFTAL